MQKNKLIRIVNDFKGKKVGVIGDLMLDEFIWGDTERLSPEAPVPVVLVEKESFNPGGAGNAAANIVALGGEADLAGLVGEDSGAEVLVEELNKRKINTAGIIRAKNNPTIRKTRVVARGQQVVRIDRENHEYINSNFEKKLAGFVASKIENWDALIVSDYTKGLITENLNKKIIGLANKYKKPIICDTKPKHFHYFKNITLLTPNHKEASEMAKTGDLKKAGRFLQEQLKSNILITQGSQGMTLFDKNKIKHFSAQSGEIFDVGGAGDTVVAGLAISLASGANLEEACFLANLVAGIVVGKVGVATVTQKELISALQNIKL